MIELTLLQSLVLFLLLGSVVGLLTGALMLWRPDWLARLSQGANRWVSTRRMMRPLERQHDVDHWMYRHGRWGGTFLLIGALYIIYMLLAGVGRADLLAGMLRARLLQPALIEPMLDSLVLILLGGAVFALLVGMFLLMRPSLLKELEHGANQNVSLRQSLKPLEVQHDGLEQLVARHRALVGVLLLLGSLYTLVMLAYWLARHAPA